MKICKHLVKISLLALVAGAGFTSCSNSSESESRVSKVKVFGVFAAPIEEQFGGVIDEALRSAADDGKIEYSFIDRIGHDGDFQRVLEEICQKEEAAIVIGDGFGNEEAVRKVAEGCLKKYFVFSQEGQSSEPNLVVLENHVLESAFLAGMVAGGSTKSNIVGVVGAKPLAHVNQMTNAFIAGAQFMNPKVTIKVSFNGSYFDKSLAQDSARQQIKNGVDIIYALCLGVEDAIDDDKTKIISNLGPRTDAQSISVMASVVWSPEPKIQFVIDQVANNIFALKDIESFNISARDIDSLLKINIKIVSTEIIDKVTNQLVAIQSGTFKIKADAEQPAEIYFPN